MKSVQCGYPQCSSRRSHHESLKMTRPHRTIEVSDQFVGCAYCSIECRMYHEAELKRKMQEINCH